MKKPDMSGFLYTILLFLPHFSEPEPAWQDDEGSFIYPADSGTWRNYTLFVKRLLI